MTFNDGYSPQKTLRTSFRLWVDPSLCAIHFIIH